MAPWISWREYAAKGPANPADLSDQKSYRHQMNLGLKAAQGEYIGIVETDDYVPANMFGDLYAIAVQEQADMVKADFYRFREVGTRIERIYNRLDPTDSSYNRIVDPAREPRVFRLIMNTWSGIYSRAFLLQNGIVHNESPGASYQDNGFWFQTFCCARRAYFVDRPYYMNRRDNAESSVANPCKVFCMSEEWAFIYDWLKRDAERFGTFKGVYTLRKYHSLLFTYQRIAPAFREEFIRHFGSEMRRHLEAGEYDRTMFTGYEWRRLRMIAYSPDVYHGIWHRAVQPCLCLQADHRVIPRAAKPARAPSCAGRTDWPIDWKCSFHGCATRGCFARCIASSGKTHGLLSIEGKTNDCRFRDHSCLQCAAASGTMPAFRENPNPSGYPDSVHRRWLDG